MEKVPEILNRIFFAQLLNEKVDLQDIPFDCYEQIAKFSRANMLSGILLENINFEDNKNKLIKKLQEERRISIAQNMLMKRSLLQIIDQFNKNNIAFILFKGSSFLFDDRFPIDKRFSKDLDILVKGDDVEKAYYCLKKLNFSYKNKLVTDTAWQPSFMHQLPTLVNNEKIYLELHTRVTQNPFLRFAPLQKYSLSQSKDY